MEYQYERFKLNKFCEFTNREVESDFMEYEKTASLNIVRFMVLLMGSIFVLFAVSDYYFYGDGNAFFISLSLRGVVLFLATIIFTVSGKVERYDRLLILVSITELLVFLIYLINLYIQKAHEPSLQFMSVMLFILTVFLIPNLWKNCVIVSSIMLATYVLFGIFLNIQTGSPSITQRGIYLFICLISCAIFLYGRETSRRGQFATEKLLVYMSITDRLTSIYNRGRFEYVLGLWIKNMRHDPFCLLLFDIDDFKKVNDRFGHNAGDQVLLKTTEVISANIRDDDIFARWGGEEFVVLFGNTALERATEFAGRLLTAVANNDCGEAGKITISIGIAQFHRPESILEFINRADQKMYEAKKAGKNRVIAEDPSEIKPKTVTSV